MATAVGAAIFYGSILVAGIAGSVYAGSVELEEGLEIWKSDSNKILSVIRKLYANPHVSSYDLPDIQQKIILKRRKAYFEKTLKKTNKNLPQNMMLQSLRLKDFSKTTGLSNYGKKYKSRLQKKYKRRLINKYGVLGDFPDWDLMTLSAKLGSAFYSTKRLQDFLTYNKLLESKLAACKKCYLKPYYSFSFEIGFPEKEKDNFYEICSQYSHSGKLLISVDSNDNTCNVGGELKIIAFLYKKLTDEETLTLKKGALYSLHGELHHVRYKDHHYGGTYPEIILGFAIKDLKSIQIIE